MLRPVLGPPVLPWFVGFECLGTKPKPRVFCAVVVYDEYFQFKIDRVPLGLRWSPMQRQWWHFRCRWS